MNRCGQCKGILSLFLWVRIIKRSTIPLIQDAEAIWKCFLSETNFNVNMPHFRIYASKAWVECGKCVFILLNRTHLDAKVTCTSFKTWILMEKQWLTVCLLQVPSMKKPKVKHFTKGFYRLLLAGLKPQLPNSLLIVYTNHSMIKTNWNEWQNKSWFTPSRHCGNAN